ncbi:right-handed parallel beta-helix repeat-containing protein [Paenibacillus taihuensis]|nr:right-handed parallel beta-helix repeat-containing protein [Paenibacillus taihuensis]
MIRSILMLICTLFIASGWMELQAIASPAAMSADLIQTLIDKAQDGDTVRIPPGSYEGRILINRPIQLDGGGAVTLRNTDQKSTVEITAKGVALKGLIVVHEARDKNAAVSVSSDEVRINSLDIRTGGYGILLRKADRGIVANTKIEWLEDANAAAAKTKIVRHNGIDLFNSHLNVIQGNTVSNMNDGIYLESSNGNTVINNAIDHHGR